jgi:glutamate formiminotransferase / formiminotetrahydrofolate cyclodeaminase
MSIKKIIECVPNFSEGIDLNIINAITNEISAIDGVKLLDVDPGKATNRTVVTIVGEPSVVIQAAFMAIKKASELIDMSKHKGAHPRMGAADVCPLIPVAGISMEETAEWANKLAKRVGEELNIPVYLYGYAQPNPNRNNLSIIRSGEYEGFFTKINNPDWKPDFGPTSMNAKSGATVIGARDFLIAYNVNLNTTSTRIANRIAFDVREAGRIIREGNPYTGKIKLDELGNPVKVAGKCKEVKAIGWYIEEYGIAQISANLTNYKVTPLHILFEEINNSAVERGVRVTGSELVGLIPLDSILDAGKYFLKKQKRSIGVSESELIKIAVKSLGLDELSPFDPFKKIIEYQLSDTSNLLIQKSLKEFANETASESPAPGGGSISAYVGSLGVSLGTMVANLSAHKRGWEDKWELFSNWAESGQQIKDELLFLVDEDTRSFNAIMNGFQMPNETEQEKRERSEFIEAASVYAAQVPLKVIKTTIKALGLLKEMVVAGNPNSITDAGVGALCIAAAAEGAGMNVRINAKGLKNKDLANQLSQETIELVKETKLRVAEIINLVEIELNK